MDIDQIEAFVAVAHCGSYSKARVALSHRVEVSAIALRIKALEESLGVSLFVDRKGVASQLTPEGQLFLPYAYRVLNSVTEARGVLTHTDTLTIASARSICAYVLPDALKKVRQMYPATMLVVLAAPSTQILDMVQTRRADVGLRFARGVADETGDDVSIENFDEDPLLLFCKNDPDTVKEIDVAELSTRALIVFEKGSTSWAMTHDLFRQDGCYPNVLSEVDSVETAKKLVQHGLGFCFLPERAVRQELMDGSIVQVKVWSGRKPKRLEPKLARRIEFIQHNSSMNAVGAALRQALDVHTKAKVQPVGQSIDPVSGVKRQTKLR